MGGRPTCRTARPRRRVRFTLVRRHWRRPTKKASRSAYKASGLTHRSGGGNPAALFFRLLLIFEATRDRRLFLVVATCAVVVHLGALWNQFALDDVTNRGRESARAIAQRRLARVRGPILARQSGRTRVSSPSWRVVGPTITVRADG